MHKLLVAFPLVLVLAACGSSSSSNDTPPPEEGDLFVSSVTPDSGTLLGGTRLTIKGGGFSAGVESVLIDGVPATEVSTSGDTTVSCTTPAGTDPGSVDVTVVTAIESATLPGGFRYHQPPAVLAVVPPAGFAFGALTVSILGFGFQRDDAGRPEVYFGDTLSPQPQVVSDTLIFATTPPLPPGVVDVTVVNANGEDTLPNGFVYLGARSNGAPQAKTLEDGVTEAVLEDGDGTTSRWWWPDLVEGRAAWTDLAPTNSDRGSRSDR